MVKNRNIFRLAVVALVLSVLPCVGATLPGADTPLAVPGKQLAFELGCSQCHTELPQNASFRETTPDLSSAGLRYQPSWLFEFLQNPVRVRQHLGRARMPAFALSRKEALALTAFLETQREISGSWPPIPSIVTALENSSPTVVSKEQFDRELAGGLICLTCHDYAGQGGHRAVELTNVSLRVQRSWMAQYLVAPAMFGVPATTMPAQFFEVTKDRSGFRELINQPARKIRIVVDHLFSLNSARRETLEKRLLLARRDFPGVVPAMGEALFQALNCVACHRHNSILPKKDPIAPSLALEGLRVQERWLAAFLTHPSAIRPFGFQPGGGARMPDFHLSQDEVRAIAAFLLSQREGNRALPEEYHPERRSAFALRKASLLLSDKLSCLGCHRFGERGGMIGPDLTNARDRLKPDYVLGIIRNPRVLAPHSIMPKAPIPDDTARLLADFLLQDERPANKTEYLSPLEHPLISALSRADPAKSTSNAEQNYARYCAACHGLGGRGDGFNARFLGVNPTHHADASLMNARADDTLFDGIHGGGYILNKSQFMPAWGNTFTTEETRGLVRYIRKLCRCEGPAWSQRTE